MRSLVPGSHRLRQLLIFAVAALLYAGTLRNDFVLDDRSAIRDNPIVHRGDLLEIFTTDYWAGFHDDRSGLYRPLPILTFAINYQLSGADPLSYHLINLLLHAAAALLLYHFCLRCTRSPHLSWWSALLFAAHPAQSEAVAGLVGRADLMATLFTLLALCRHLQARHSQSRKAYLTAGMALTTALLSKESAIVLPALFLLTDLFQYRAFPEKRYRKDALHLAAPHLLYTGILLLYLAWHWHLLGGLGVPAIDRLDNPLVALSLPLRLLNATQILFRYLGLLLLPVQLSADYSFAALSLTRQLWSVDLLLVSLGLLVLIGLLWATWRSAPWTAFGLAWILLALAPVANILLPIGTIMAERLLYLPTAGFALALASLLAHRRFYRPALQICCYLLLFLYASATITRTRDWRDDFTLFERTVQVRPGSARAWRAFGKAALERNQDQRGLSALQKALQILPDYGEVYDDLGSYYFAHEEYRKALEFYATALKIRNDYPHIWLNLGLTRYRLGDRQAARKAMEKAIALDPGYAKAHYDLGVLLLEEGELEQAAASFERTLSLHPAHVDARFNLEATLRALEQSAKK